MNRYWPSNIGDFFVDESYIRCYYLTYWGWSYGNPWESMGDPEMWRFCNNARLGNVKEFGQMAGFRIRTVDKGEVEASVLILMDCPRRKWTWIGSGLWIDTVFELNNGFWWLLHLSCWLHGSGRIWSVAAWKSAEERMVSMPNRRSTDGISVPAENKM